MALKSDGTVWAWGGKYWNGQFYKSSIPEQISNLSNITAIACGWYHNITLKSDGTVWAWGGNGGGQLGDGTTTDSFVPVQAKINLYKIETPTPTPTTTTTLTPTPIPSPTPSSSNIFGFVYDLEEEPIQDVTVTIKGDNYSGITSTDEYGYYELKNLSSGDYRASA